MAGAGAPGMRGPSSAPIIKSYEKMLMLPCPSACPPARSGRGGVRVHVVVVQRRRGAVVHDLAPVDHDRAGDQRAQRAQFVRDEDDRATVRDEVAQAVGEQLL